MSHQALNVRIVVASKVKIKGDNYPDTGGKLTKTKGAFPNKNSLLKLLYAGILNATRK